MQQQMEILTIWVTAQEAQRLRELVGTSYDNAEHLVSSFIVDLMYSDGCNGEEEHEAAMGWYKLLRSKWG